MTGALDGRRVAVAGAGGSLGPHVVAAFAAAGAWVAVADRRIERLEAVAGRAGDVWAGDLATPEGAAQWARHLGAIDAVIHLVGGWRGGTPLEDLDLDDLQWLERVLFHTVVHTSRAFAPALKAAGPAGRFAMVSSSVASRPTAGNAAYAATKAAAEAWTLAFGAELADSGATANVVEVVAIVTPAMRAENPDKAYRTFTDAADIAAGLVFLCTDAAGKMNAQRLALHA